MSSLSEDDRRALLRLAREAVTNLVAGRSHLESIPTYGVFSVKRGLFVTLRIQNQLRGCIGIPEPAEPLGRSVVHCAVSAACDDARFSPLAAHELDHLQVEMSMLSAMVPIRPQEIELGRHGLMIVYKGKRGLLLPQVATDHRLNRERFLEETCRKAGLPVNAWKDPDAQILGFTAEVFSDQKGDSYPADVIGAN